MASIFTASSFSGTPLWEKVSIIGNHVVPNCSGGSVNSIGSWWALKHRMNEVGDPLAAHVSVGDALPVEIHGDPFAESGIPVFVAHLGAVRAEPGDVRNAPRPAATDGPTVEEPASAEHRVPGPAR